MFRQTELPLKSTHKISPDAYKFGTLATWFVAMSALLMMPALTEVIWRKTALAEALGVDPRDASGVSHLVFTGVIFICAVRFHYWLYVGRLNRLGIRIDSTTFSDFLSGFLRKFRRPLSDAELIERVHARGELIQSERDELARNWDKN